MARGQGCTTETGGATPRGGAHLDAADQAELDAIFDGTHPRVYLGLSRIERARERGWTDAEILQVARELTAVLDDYETLLDDPRFRRVLRWGHDRYLAESAADGWHRDPRNPYLPKQVGVTLLSDDNEEKDGWGVTDAPSRCARTDTRRPGVRSADSATDDWMAYAADPRYTLFHESHHMHGSGSEFDVGSDVAFAWHVVQHDLHGPGPDSIRRQMVMQMLRDSGPRSRVNMAIRSLLGDEAIDAWAVDLGYRDLFGKRPQPVEDTTIAGRAAWIAAMDCDYADKVDVLRRRNMVEASEAFTDELHEGEVAFMRANGDALALAPDGSARVLYSNDA